MVIDAHVHISTESGKGGSLEDSLEMLLSEMRQNEVGFAIVIPDNLENDPKISDLDSTLRLIAGHDNLFSLCSPQIIQRGDTEVGRYRGLLNDGAVRGLKLFPGHDPYNPSDVRCQAYYGLLQELGYPVVIHTGEHSSDPNIHNPLEYNDPKYIVEVAEKYPRLKVVISHYYWPKIEYCYEITRDVSNIYFDLAACADDEVLAASGGIQKMRQIISQTIKDRPDKVIFGTDWPLCESKSEGGFKKHLDLVKSLELTHEVEEMVLWKNTNQIYKLGLYE